MRRYNTPQVGRGLLTLALVLCAPSIICAQQMAVEFYHLDAQGNVLALTAWDGTVVESHDYDVFGQEVAPQGANTQPKRFAGKERDTETGWDYFGARYYGSKVGRFTTVDPVLRQKAALADPQRWNRYSYARNNPFRFGDPDGKELVEVQLPGIGRTYLDDAFAPRVQQFVQNAQQHGLTPQFNSAYRTPEQQRALQSDPNAVTPAQQSLHSAGFAVDVNYDSLPNDAQRQVLRDAATAAGLDWGGSFRPPDRPHFYSDPGGDRAQRIRDAAARYRQLTQPASAAQAATPAAQAPTPAPPAPATQTPPQRQP